MLVRRFIEKIKWIYKARIIKDPLCVALSDWYKAKGDTTLRVDYPLTSESVVLDIGGYSGDWSLQIANRYNPHLFIFEPVPFFFEKIQHKFASNSKVKVFNYGLSDTTQRKAISILEDGSSVFRSSDNRLDVSFVNICEFLENTTIGKIDLVKINIEGGEYLLLPKMVDSGIVNMCMDIQVQFHNFVPGAYELRRDIRESLSRTHRLTYDFSFVWENWRHKCQPVT